MNSRKILAILSEYEYWGIEIKGSLRKHKEAGLQSRFHDQI